MVFANLVWIGHGFAIVDLIDWLGVRRLSVDLADVARISLLWHGLRYFGMDFIGPM